MIHVPPHVTNTKIRDDIRMQGGNKIVVLQKGGYFFFKRRLRFFKGKVFLSFVLIFSIVLYTTKLPTLKADSVVFYPAACLGGFDLPKNAEGKPDTEIDAHQDEFTKNNAAYLGKERNAELFCGNFDGKVTEHTSPKEVVLTVYLAQNNLQHEKNIIENDGGGSALEVLDSVSIPVLVEATTTQPQVDVTSAQTENTNVTPSSDVPVEKSEATENKLEKPEIDEPVSTPPPTTTTEGDQANLRQRFLKVFSYVALSVYAEEVAAPVEAAPEVSVAPETPLVVSPESTEVISPPQALPETVSDHEEVSVIPESTTEIIPSAQTDVSQKEQENSEEAPTETVPLEAEKVGVVETLTSFISDKLQDIGNDASTSDVVPVETDDKSIGEIISEKIVPFESILTVVSTSTSNPEYEILFSKGGDTWESLALLGKENTKTLSFKIPYTPADWSDIANLQVQIKSLQTFEERNDLYIDGMELTISYESELVKEERQYFLEKSESVRGLLTASFTGPKGERKFLDMKAEKEGGLALYNLETGALLLTTELTTATSTYDPNGIIPEYGSFVAVLTSDEGWCGQKALKVCVSATSTEDIAFFSLLLKESVKDSKGILLKKKELKTILENNSKAAEPEDQENDKEKLNLVTLNASSSLNNEDKGEYPQKTLDQKEERVDTQNTVEEKNIILPNETNSSEVKVEDVKTEENVL